MRAGIRMLDMNIEMEEEVRFVAVSHHVGTGTATATAKFVFQHGTGKFKYHNKIYELRKTMKDAEQDAEYHNHGMGAAYFKLTFQNGKVVGKQFIAGRAGPLSLFGYDIPDWHVSVLDGWQPEPI